MNGRRTGTGHASGKVTLVGCAFQPQPAYLLTRCWLLLKKNNNNCPLTTYFASIHNEVCSLTNGGSFLYAQRHINFCCLYYTLILSAPVPRKNFNKLLGMSPSQELTVARQCTEYRNSLRVFTGYRHWSLFGVRLIQFKPLHLIFLTYLLHGAESFLRS